MTKVSRSKPILLLFLPGAIALILAIEAMCRIYPLELSPLIQPSSISKLGWEFVPNSAGQTSGNLIKINSHGLRDYEFSTDKPQGIFLILTLGSSFTYGVGLPLGKTYPKILEGTLNRNISGKHYQVINAGFPEYNLSQISAYLQKKADYLQPDLILISIEPESLIKEFIPSGYENELRIKSPLRRITTALKQKSYLASFIYNYINNLRMQMEIDSFKYLAQLKFPAEPNPALFKDTIGSLMHKEIVSPLIPVTPEKAGRNPIYFLRKSTTPLPKEALIGKKDAYIQPKSPIPTDYRYNLLQFLGDTKRPYWQGYKKNFEEIADYSQKTGIPIVLVIWPLLPYENNTASYTYLELQIEAVAKDNAISSLKISSFLKGEVSNAWIQKNNNLYPNAALHLLASEALYKFLKKSFFPNLKPKPISYPR